MVIAPHILCLDPNPREFGVAVFVGASLQYFAIKTLPRRLPVDDRLRQARNLTLSLMTEYQPDIVILSRKRLPSPTLQAITQHIRRTAQAHALVVRSYTLADARRAICASPTATRQEIRGRLIARFPVLRHYGVQPTKWQTAYRQRMFAAIAAGYTDLRSRQ